MNKLNQCTGDVAWLMKVSFQLTNACLWVREAPICKLLPWYWCFNCPNFRRIAKVANSQLKNTNESSELNFYQIIRIGADLQFVQQMQLQSFFLSIFFPSYFLRCIILQEEEVSHRKKMCAKFNLNANLLTFPRTQTCKKMQTIHNLCKHWQSKNFPLCLAAVEPKKKTNSIFLRKYLPCC